MSKVSAFIQAISKAYPHALVFHNDGGKTPGYYIGGVEYTVDEVMLRDGKILTPKDLVPHNSKSRIPKQYMREPLEANLAQVGRMIDASPYDQPIVFVRYDGSNKVFKVGVDGHHPLPQPTPEENPSPKSPWAQ